MKAKVGLKEADQIKAKSSKQCKFTDQIWLKKVLVECENNFLNMKINSLNMNIKSLNMNIKSLNMNLKSLNMNIKSLNVNKYIC